MIKFISQHFRTWEKCCSKFKFGCLVVVKLINLNLNESEHKKGQFEPARVRKLNEKHFRCNAMYITVLLTFKLKLSKNEIKYLSAHLKCGVVKKIVLWNSN
jgi:hypothetical protein